MGTRPAGRPTNLADDGWFRDDREVCGLARPRFEEGFRPLHGGEVRFPALFSQQYDATDTFCRMPMEGHRPSANPVRSVERPADAISES